jgi:aquaporin Z
MAKYVVEFIGTFFLVLTIGLASGPLAPLAIGSVLMVMIFAGGHISGGHFNPAVTLAVCLRGKCPRSDVLPYWGAQVLAAALAAIVVRFMNDFPSPSFSPAAKIYPQAVKALVAEFLFTFALCYVVLNVATAKGTSGNSFYGLAIGFTVLAGAVSVGPISGGVFNPAVAVGITIMGVSAVLNIWIFLVANFAAAVAAASVFRFVNREEVAAA